MATRTLKAKYETLDGSVTRNRSILCHAKNVKEFYYQYDDEVEAPASSAEAVGAPTVATPTARVTTTVAVSAPSSGPLASVEDAPIKATDILLLVVAQKLKKRVDEIPLSRLPKISLVERSEER